MASTEDVVEKLARNFQEMNYPIDELRITLTALLNTFDADVLLEANTKSDGQVFQTFSEIAIAAAKHRKEKFEKTRRTQIAASDFVPAFMYFTSTGVYVRNQFRRIYEQYLKMSSPLLPSELSQNVVAAIRRCCPWC